MDAKQFNEVILDPAGRALKAIGIPWSYEAQLLLLTICGQESGWSARFQSNNGPARGFAQFEKSGGYQGVLNHPASKTYAKRLMNALLVPEALAWDLLPYNDTLSLGFARLLLWTDSEPLAPLTADKGWRIYNRVWRPGKPRPEVWGTYFQEAQDALLVE